MRSRFLQPGTAPPRERLVRMNACARCGALFPPSDLRVFCWRHEVRGSVPQITIANDITEPLPGA